MATTRQYVEAQVISCKNELQGLQNYLETAPKAVLDLEAETIYVWTWHDSQEEFRYEVEMDLGKCKQDEKYRGASAKLLSASIDERVETRTVPQRPGYFFQTFVMSDHAKVKLSWVDPKLAQVPCHKIVVQRTQVIEWCGPEDSPPLREGDIIIQEDR